LIEASYLILAKSLKITILLAILVSGVGHIYLGVTKRGIIILVVAIALWIIIPLFVPIPYSWVFTGIYWIWQIVDVYRIYKKMDSGQTQITDFKR
jgi:TM2 domain-containing membrane protein YozV